MSKVLLVRTTFSDTNLAGRIARQMIEERLAACASISPVHSVYRWRGDIEAADETVVLFKTTPDRATTLRARIEALHDYDQPVIESWEAEVDAAAGDWVYTETS